MKKILFVCHGNICRSPMAEFVMKRLVADAGLGSQFQIDSAATSTEEIGNPVYPPARRKLAEHGISCAGKTARQVTRHDYQYYDLLIAMDQNNIRNLKRMLGGGDPQGKIHLLLDFADDSREVADPNRIDNETVPRRREVADPKRIDNETVPRRREVADPWYTGNFDATWQDCMTGCTALLRYLAGKDYRR